MSDLSERPVAEPAAERGALKGLSREEKALLFERLRRKKPGAGTETNIPRRPAGLDRVPLSFAQERLWFLDRLQPGSSFYNMPQALALLGEVSPAALEAAVSEVVRRHEALRTTFRERDGQPEQVIAPPARWVLPLVDLTRLPQERRQIEVRRLADQEAQRPYDLERGPLLRGALLLLDEREHVLLLGMHHIVSDGWSTGVLVGEITALYGSVIQGEPSPLPELPIQYADFAVWQRAWLQGEVLERQLGYWRERLADAPSTLELPGGRPRPAVQSFLGEVVQLELGDELHQGLLALSREHDATLFMTLLAVYQALLARWTGQWDILIGSPIANRNRTQIAPLIGFFVNTVVMRSDVAGDPTFSQLLERVRRTALDAYLHQDLPFERLVEELRPERHLSQNPLFQTMFALQNAPRGQVDFSDISLAPVEFEAPTAKFDLELVTAEQGGRLEVVFTYSRDLFDEPTIRRLAEHFLNLIAAALTGPGLLLSELPLLSEPERHQLLEEWNDTRAEGTPVGALQRFAAEAARTPGAEAVVSGAIRLSYGELDRRSSYLARRLRTAGVGPGVTVGLCVERSPDLVVGLLGIWKAGGAYVPMDPAHPRARLAWMLEDSAVPVLVTQEHLAGTLPQRGARVVLLEEGEDEVGLGHAPAPDEPAYLIYTSGTTGQPKAVVVEHRQLASTLTAIQAAFGFGPGDRMPCVAPFSFDIFLFELLGPLLAGGTAVLMPLRPTLDVERLVDELESATLLHAVPALMRQVVETARRRRGVGKRLRALFVGGDVVPAELLADLRDTFPEARIWVLYGPTEAAIVCTAWEVPAEGPVRSLLGRPLPGAELTLRDPAGRLAAIGVPGEIWIGGSGVTRGYWRREELTAEKFVEAGGERFFRSGDLARQLPDGTFEFLGRIDQQVKVRGFRIELGEVEAALARHAEVREAVAAVREEPSGSRQLVAYVVRRPAAEIEVAPEEVSEHVSQWQTLYEETYGRSEAVDATFDLQGWNSSYTGEPIPDEEMHEWVDRTVERVLALGPRKVLEIGCGTGLLLFRIAPHTERYLGTDFSRLALDGIRRELDRLPQVELSQRRADDWIGIPSGAFDVVVLNSVAQYFPGVEYLARVLEGAVRAVAPGGKIFVGDVRSLPLLEALHASVELYWSPGERSVAELRRRVARRVADEEELVLAPGFFLQVPRVTGVEVLLKRGAHHNELTRFRYDVVLWVGEAPPSCPPPLPAVPLPGGEGPLRALETLLSGPAPEEFVVEGLLNARLVREAAAVELLAGVGQEMETVEELRQAIAERTEAGVDPEALPRLAEQHGYTVELMVDLDSPFHFGAVLRSKSSTLTPRRPSHPGRGTVGSGRGQVGGALSLYANDPLRAKLARRLVPELRRFLQAELPDYMVPSAFMLLERLPVTAHGKVDRSALPEPEISRLGLGQGLAPRTPVEETLAQVWIDLLGLDRVGVEDNFFELGGHSLLATQAVSRLRDRLGVELPVRLLFEEPTIAGLAARIEQERGGETAAIPPTRRDRPLPLSFAQERMWFLHELDPLSPAYNISLPLRLSGDIRPGVLAETLRSVARRHETLRTTFPRADGRPYQAITPEPGDLLAEVDLRGLPREAREGELARLSAEEALRPFDLTRGPLLRATLLHLDGSGERGEGALLLAMHHIISDGWSGGILVRDVGAIYAALLRDAAPVLKDLPIQYADFAAWQRGWLQGEALERELAYWRTQLAGEAPALDLPADHPRPAMPSGRGAVRSFELPPSLVPAMEAFGRGEGATAFMTTLAAFLAVLGRYTGQGDFWIGSPVANRNRSEIEDLIGFFVNTLVMRTRVEGDPSFRELLARVRETALGAYAHQNLPFERLVEELRPERDPSRSPLFQVMFAVQNAPGGELHLPGLDVAPLPGDGAGAVQFDLTFFLWPSGDNMVGTLQYSLDLFEAATIDRLAGHFQTLLAGAVGEPAARVADLPLLTEAERRQILDWNEVEILPAGETLHGLFAAQARRTPEALALIAGEERLTYAALAGRAGRLARRLRAWGVGPEVPVAILMPRSADLVVALLAVLEAGGFYVPIDPAYPEERVAFLLADSGAQVVLREVEDQGPEEETGEVLPGNLAYLIYTSGSTGRPKAVAIEHRSAALLARWARGVFGDRELAAVLASTSVTFDLSVFEIFVPLAWGGTVILADNALALPSLPAAGEVTLINTVPSAIAELLRAGALPDSLVTVNLAGEALARPLADRIYERPGIERLYNLYGPSEDTTYSTWTLVERASERAPSIGRPVSGTRAWVMDRGLRPSPMGVPGELCLGGGGLARGYQGRPQLTAERFVPDPYAGEPGARMYRTGDLARYRPDGSLEFLGRLDHQVKVRGFRIELGEVETALVGLGVREAAVLAWEDRLVAYVAPAELRTEDLREGLRRRLPEFMVPSLWVTLEALPRTATGKLDRRALQTVAPEGIHPAAGAAAPRTPTEERLAAIWAQVLGIPEEGIGAFDNFFDLGGHSLLATQVVSRVRDQLGVELPLKVLFEAPTLAGLARRIEAEAGGVTTSSPIVPVPRDQAMPLSLMQERLWFLHQLDPLSPAYNIPSPLWLAGDLLPDLLAETLRAVMRRHEALRTTFPVHAGRPYQAIAAEPPDVLVQVDLRALPAAARDAELTRLAARESLRPFDLVHGPVLRAILVRIIGGEGALLLTVHHIVSDGWSTGILVRDVTEIYGALLRGGPPSLPALPIQYADFAQWQRRWAWSGALQQELDWWRGHLAGEIPALELPTDHSRPAMLSGLGGRHMLELPAAFIPALESLGRRQGATFFMTTLAVFSALLARYTGQEDLWVGSPVAGRDRSEVEDLVGFFVNTLVMRTRAGGDPTFRELLGRVREAALGAFAHQHVPFEKLVEELRPERDPSRSPLFQVVFGLQNAPGGHLELPGLEIRGLSTGRDVVVQFDLNCFLLTEEGRLVAALEYSRDLFEATTIARLGMHLRTLFVGVVADPESPLSALPLLAEAERQQLLREWNDTVAALPAADLATLFRAQAERRPAAVAVSSEEGELTYADLAARSGRLARRLASLGVGPESVVGLLADRSPALIVGMLAILEAGGAYLPLDPGYPAERLAGMLEDARVRLILGQTDLLAALPERARDAVEITVPLEADPEETDGPAQFGPLPEGLAYVMFTSGSTGRPKPVGVTHRNVVRLVRGSGFADLGPEQVWLQLAPISFDASTLEIWAALANGGRLALFPQRRPALGEVGEAVARWGVTSLWLTSGLFHQMVDGPLESLRPLRQLLAGGDVLSPPHVRRAVEALPGCMVINGYGPTEGTTFTTCYTVTGDVGATVPIGVPIGNTRVYVLDRDLRPMPIGCPGELYAAGEGIARGYLGRPDLTAERFVPDPFTPGGRLYRTGDQARCRADGRLEFLGRRDGQVKLRGFRVELGEIEAALAGHSQVMAAAVLVRDDGDRRLAACVVASGSPAPDARALRQFLLERLPGHMVPAEWAFLDTLPLSPNGKVDRRALRGVVLEGVRAAEGFLPPRTPTEERLAAIWGQVLNSPSPVGVLDDFFELGGHSLLATQVVSRVQESFGVDLPLRALFESPRLLDLAVEIESAAGRAGVRLPEVRRTVEGEGYPLSYSQERLWFLDRLTPGSPAYNIPSPLRLLGPLDLAVLERCFEEVIRRHESLRTRFAEQDGTPVQIVDPPCRWPLPVVDLTALPETLRELETERRMIDEATWPFDLARGPLIRTTVLRTGSEQRLLLMTLHHIVSDGWSNNVLVQELTALYRAFAAGRPSPLPELPLQYADFARWQRERLSGPALEGHLAYWRQQLAGSPPSLDLPLDRPRPAVQTVRGSSVFLDLGVELTAGLRTLSVEQRSSLFMVLLAAFKLLLHRLSGQADVVVGAPVAGRDRRDFEGLIGFFLNTLTLRTDLSGRPSFRELVQRERTTVLGAFSHQEVPFEKLLADLQPERDLSRTPLFQVFFNMLNFPWAAAELPGGVAVEPVHRWDIEAKFDVTVYAFEAGPEIRLGFVYNVDLFDRVRVEEMTRQFRTVLAQVVADPGLPIDRVSLLTPEAVGLLPDPAAPLGEEWHGAVHELFAGRARRHPERPALIDAEGIWTYGELSEAVNRLAARLREGGVGRGDRVAIYAHRSAPVVWAVLATLEAGGAFVLLDPAYPAARLAETVRLASPRAWVRIAAAGEVPPELERLLPACRVSLPGGGPEGARTLIAGLPPAGPPVEIGPDDIAYVAFTSGSTGTPKGILGRHGPLSQFLPWQCETFGLGESDRYSLLSGLAHDPLQRDMFTPLSTGATLCIPTLEEIATPGRLASWMARQEITVSHLTPAMGQILTEPGPGGEIAEIPTLRYTLLVGDVLTRLDVDRIRSIAPRVTVVNLYGSTETQRAVGFHVVAEGGVDEGRAKQVLPLGRGMRDVQLLVVSGVDAPALAGVGEVGEIWVRSPHLAKGYLGDEALTVERFRTNPFTGRPGDRVYRTGDLGRYLPDGQAVFAGRADQQVKIRGFRIELGEIEATLGRLPGVREVVVLARQDSPDPGARRLVAYVVPDPENPADVEALRDHLRERLPAYMVPAAFVRLDRLPVTPNGKVDRRALPAPEGLDAGLETAYVEPESDLERTIASVWREVLGLEKVGVRHNFFDLGGHSLLLVRLHARLQEALQRELSLIELFNYPSIRALAEHLGRRTAEASGAAGLEGARDRAQKQIEAARRQKELAKARRRNG